MDTNALVHAHREESLKHISARMRLVDLAQAPARRGLPLFCVGEFPCVITHPRLFDPRHSASEARRAMERVLASPGLSVLCPGVDYPALLLEAVHEGDAIGNLAFDARIVASCHEHGVSRLVT